MYAQMENNEIIKVYYIKPEWYTANPDDEESRQLTDEELLALDVWPVIDDKPDNDENFFQIVENDYTQWIVDIENKKVTITYTITAYTIEQVKEKLKRKVNALEKNKELGGLNLTDGTFIRTDEKTQSRISQAFVQVQNYPDTTYKWKMADGSFEILDKDRVAEIYNAIHEHIEACFDKEYDLCQQIENATTIEELENIDFAFDI